MGGIVSSIFGGSNSQNATTTTQSNPPAYLGPALGTLATNAVNLANKPYPGYTGQLYAGLQPYQKQGYEQLASITPQTGALSQANTALGDAAGGGIVRNAPGLTETNPYFGQNNPYTQQMIDAVSGDITRNYQTAVAPQTDAQANMAGAFGGSGWLAQTANNQYQLGQNLANASSVLRQQDWNNQANLAQQQIANRQGAYQSGTTAQMQAAGLIPGVAQTMQGLQTDAANAKINAGLGYQAGDQAALNNQQNQAASQMNWPYFQQQALAQAIAAATGAGGGSQTSTGPASYAANPIASLAGLTSTAGGLYRMFGGSGSNGYNIGSQVASMFGNSGGGGGSSDLGNALNIINTIGSLYTGGGGFS